MGGSCHIQCGYPPRRPDKCRVECFPEWSGGQVAQLDGATASLCSLLHDSGPDNLDFVHRFVLCVCLDQPHSLNHPHPTLDPAEDRVFSVKPRCWRQGDEELATIGIRTAIRHAQNARAGMFQVVANLVFKLLAVDRAAAAAGAGRVAGLDHEIRDDAVEYDIVVVSSLRESRKVLAGLRKQASAGDRRGQARSTDLGSVGVIELHRERTLREVSRSSVN